MRKISVCLAALGAAVAGCVDHASGPAPDLDTTYSGALSVRPNEPIEPLPQAVTANTAVVRLGERIYHDPILSADDTVACASCHVVAEGGDDGLDRSVGIGGAKGGINAPTVLNSGFNRVQFWDGRAETLQDQAAGPVANPAEMGHDWDAIAQKVASDSFYGPAFRELFPEGATKGTITAAIATYERTLITPNSPFDQWLRGDDDALTAQELRGYELFKSAGCTSCHQGQNVGGNMYQVFGVMGDYFGDRGDVTDADLGRFNVTGNESDRHVFRVPALRNVALTAPYFHDASAASLETAIHTMATYQLGRLLDEEQVEAIAAFLKTLTGELPVPLDAEVVR